MSTWVHCDGPKCSNKYDPEVEYRTFGAANWLTVGQEQGKPLNFCSWLHLSQYAVYEQQVKVELLALADH